MLFCRGYWNDMFVCATFPKFIIDTNECFSLLQATSRKLPSNSGPPPLGPNMLMVDVFKLQNLFFPRHEGSHHHTWDFYPLNPTYSHKLVAATAAAVNVNIKFMTWTFCRLPLRHLKVKARPCPLSLLDLSLTFARLRAASLPRLAAARRLISIAPTDTELSPPELQYLPLHELWYIHGWQPGQLLQLFTGSASEKIVCHLCLIHHYHQRSSHNNGGNSGLVSA